MWRLFECLPDIPQCRRSYLRNNLFGTDRFSHYAALSRVAGLETSLQCELLMRRLHRNLSGKNQSASSSVAEPQERRGSAAIVERAFCVSLFRGDCQPPVF